MLKSQTYVPGGEAHGRVASQGARQMPAQMALVFEQNTVAEHGSVQ